MPGTGKLILTGQVGQVMQESAQAALSFVRSNTKLLGLKEDFFNNKDLHVHLPAGATPKDGPSAGITMALAILSLFTGRFVRDDVAMTGEITLQGRVFPVGGLKEKILAAYRYGINEVVIPYINRTAVDDVPKEVRDKMTFHFVKNLREVVRITLKPAEDEHKKTKDKPVAKPKPAATHKKPAATHKPLRATHKKAAVKPVKTNPPAKAKGTKKKIKPRKKPHG
jgi:ATP-dependent Lon protease